MNLHEIRELITMMNENDLLEFEVEDGDKKVRLRKLYEGVREKLVAIPSAPMMSAPVQAVAPGAPAAAPDATSAPSNSNEKRVKAPMVGTFYQSPSPELPPFVSVGDVVTKDTVLCIIEAMKVMNEIKADCDGTVVESLLENGKPVEFGQEIFVISLD
jgi:acetyl-CoA carboxylase biotin carboxyl carrier protein